METRRQGDAQSPRGGFDFEKAVTEVVVEAVRGAPILVEETGSTVGTRRNCKVGDLVLHYAPEHAFAGAALTIEAKRDASYTVPKALEELDVARANRGACSGLFVMAASHAPSRVPAVGEVRPERLGALGRERPDAAPTRTWRPGSCSPFPGVTQSASW